MSFKMKKQVCILLISLLFLLALVPILLLKKTQPEGEYITKDEIVTLTELLSTVVNDNMLAKEEVPEKIQAQKIMTELLTEKVSAWEVEEYVTYGHFKQWEEIVGEVFDVLETEKEKQLSKTYKKTFFITKKDWFEYFEKLCTYMEPEGRITTEQLLVLGDSSNVVDVEGKPIEETHVFTQNGRWEKKLNAKFIPTQQSAFYITYAGALWGVYNVEDAATLFNVWIVENTEKELIYFYKNYQITTSKAEKISSMEREQVADINFVLGDLEELRTKTKKVTGKVLKISSDEVEIEGVGLLPLSENIQYYRLFDILQNVGRSEIRLGYDFTDFVVEEGQIQAALLVKDEKMENIRVLIKNSDFKSYYHELIEGRANVDMEVIFGNEKYEIAAGETFLISPESKYFTTNRIYLRPKALTGRTVFSSIERNNGGQGYYGMFELEKTEEGILLINEVLLEEYLYAVVPSEMPGYYPLEALKAQAISARTYAYSKMLRSGLSSYGANLDDSTTYQVYNNIKENVNTTTAVKETRGQLLYAGHELAGTYYYSTSCGFSTDAGIWNSDNVTTMPYLTAKEMTLSTPVYSSAQLETEEGFKEFISKVDQSHFEAEESWYRWTYKHENMEVIAEKLKARIEKYPNYVFTCVEGKNWGNEPLEEGFTITDISVKSRGAGGTVEELLVTTDKGNILVKNEYHVRAVLTDGEAKAELQNDSSYACGNLLPSAFFAIEIIKNKEELSGIKLMGGGFGHGVGMSQNGAKNLANRGYNAEDILELYYEGCRIQQ